MQVKIISRKHFNVFIIQTGFDVNRISLWDSWPLLMAHSIFTMNVLGHNTDAEVSIISSQFCQKTIDRILFFSRFAHVCEKKDKLLFDTSQVREEIVDLFFLDSFFCQKQEKFLNSSHNLKVKFHLFYGFLSILCEDNKNSIA